MGSFVLVNSLYEGIPEFLLSNVRGFACSVEYERLNETERKLPGIVAAAFTQFFVRFQDAEMKEGLSDREARTLADAYEAIETLSRSPNGRVKTLVEEEILENIRASEGAWSVMRSRFGPAATRLLEEWTLRSMR